MVQVMDQREGRMDQIAVEVAKDGASNGSANSRKSDG